MRHRDSRSSQSTREASHGFLSTRARIGVAKEMQWYTRTMRSVTGAACVRTHTPSARTHRRASAMTPVSSSTLRLARRRVPRRRFTSLRAYKVSSSTTSPLAYLLVFRVSQQLHRSTFVCPRRQLSVPDDRLRPIPRSIRRLTGCVTGDITDNAADELTRR